MALLDTSKEPGSMGHALAGGLVMLSLFDLLIERGLITRDDARAILQRSLNLADGFSDSGIGSDAGSVIADMLKLFSE
jgi:hypothetical protein